MSENNRTIPSGGYYICNYKQDRLGKITNISSSNDVLEVEVTREIGLKMLLEYKRKNNRSGVGKCFHE